MPKNRHVRTVARQTPDAHPHLSTAEELATHLVEHGLTFVGTPDHVVLAQLHERVHQIDLNLARSAEAFDVGLAEWQPAQAAS